ncbi:MAG: hypothetical protein WBB28_02075 [Crinalium sp.]
MAKKKELPALFNLLNESQLDFATSYMAWMRKHAPEEEVSPETAIAYALYCGHHGIHRIPGNDIVFDFDNLYKGCFDSDEHFAQSELLGTHGKQVDDLKLHRSHFNWSAIARDWFMNDFIGILLRNEIDRVRLGNDKFFVFQKP